MMKILESRHEYIGCTEQGTITWMGNIEETWSFDTNRRVLFAHRLTRGLLPMYYTLVYDEPNKYGNLQEISLYHKIAGGEIYLDVEWDSSVILKGGMNELYRS